MFCGGGSDCGYQVTYSLARDEFGVIQFPMRCDGGNCARTYLSPTKGLRKNHAVNFDSVLCIHGISNTRCKISSADVAAALGYGCCPNCKIGLHGGIVNQYCLILH